MGIFNLDIQPERAKMSPTQNQTIVNQPKMSEGIRSPAESSSALLDSSNPLQQVERLQQMLDELQLRERIQRNKLQHLEDQIERARVIQRELLPKQIPTLNNSKFHIVHRPLEFLSGDCYDIARLDEHRIAFSLADATDHGIPAAMLASYVQRALRGLEWRNQQRCSLEPDEVLRRINADLLDLQLQDCQSIAAMYGIYDEQTRVIRWARGGIPYPILIRRGQEPDNIISEGPILGVTSNPQFEIIETHLQPGDRLIFHTDGLEALLLNPMSRIDQHHLTDSSWIRSFSSQPVDEQLAQLHCMTDQLDPHSWKADDLTVLLLHLDD